MRISTVGNIIGGALALLIVVSNKVDFLSAFFIGFSLSFVFGMIGFTLEKWVINNRR